MHPFNGHKLYYMEDIAQNAISNSVGNFVPTARKKVVSFSNTYFTRSVKQYKNSHHFKG